MAPYNNKEYIHMHRNILVPVEDTDTSVEVLVRAPALPSGPVARKSVRSSTYSSIQPPRMNTTTTNQDWVIREMYKDGDEIHLIHVIPVPMPEVVAGGFGAMDTVVTLDPDPKEDLKHIADAKEMMRRRFTPTLASQSIPFQVEIIHFPTDTQSIGEAVVARAGNLTSCIIAMAKHNRGKVSTFIFGSTSRYVVDHAPCPTVIVTNQSQ